MDRSCHRLTLSALVVSTDEGPIVYKTTEYKESNEVYKEVAEDVRSLSDTSAYEMRGQSL